MDGSLSAKFVKVPSRAEGVEREQISAMLHQTMEPFTAGLIRVVAPGDLSCEGTAVAKPVETFTVNWTNLPVVPGSGTGTTGGLVQLQSTISYGVGSSTLPQSAVPILGDTNWQPFVLLMDPVVAYITRTLAPKDAWAITPTGINVSYAASLMFPGVVANGTSLPEYRVDMVGSSLGIVNLPIADLKWTDGSWKPYGDYVPAGDVRGTRVVWIDGCDSIDALGAVTRSGQGWRAGLTVSIPAGYGGLLAGAWFLECRIHSNESSSETVFIYPGPTVSAGSSAGFASPSVAFSGYFSFWIRFDETVGLTPIPICVNAFTISLNTVSAYRHASLSGQETMAMVIDQVRVNGSSLLVSNVVTQYSKGGTVYGIQSNAEYPWYYWTQSLTNITSANTTMRTVQNWDKGLYCFVKPQGGLPFAMDPAYQKQGIITSVTSRNLPMFKPFGPKSYVVIVVVPPDVGSSAVVVYPTAQSTVTCCRSIEFSTNHQFFNVDKSMCSTDDFGKFADAIRVVPQFYENPLHLAAIGSLVANVARKVVEWAPRVAKGAASVLQLVGGGQTEVASVSSVRKSRSRSNSAGKKMLVVKTPTRSRSRSGSASSRGKSGSRKSSMVKLKLTKSQRRRARKGVT